MFLKISIFFFVLCLYSSIPLGMDLFYHVYSYQPSLEFAAELNRQHTLFGYSVPRYFLLSYIFNLSSVVGFPIVFLIVLLVSIPYYFIVKSLFYNTGKTTLFSYVLLFLSLILVLFYSALSLSILWLIAYLCSKKNIFRFGLFHPLALLFLPFFSKGFRQFFLYLLVVIFVFYLMTWIFPNKEAGRLGYTVSLVNIYNIFLISLEYKFKELIFLFFLLICLLVLNKINVKSIVKNQIPYCHFFIALIFVFLHKSNSMLGLVFQGDIEFVVRTYLGILDSSDFNFFWRVRG